MGTLHRLASQRRLLLGDSRGHGLGLSWHPEVGVFVVSVWDGETCMGTVHLDAAQAATLTAALGERLAEHLSKSRSEAAPPAS